MEKEKGFCYRIYVSGPMSGLKDYNYPAFENACKILLRRGLLPESPHRGPKRETWADYMRYDIALLVKCDAIALLPGWEGSRGARLEKQIAEELEMKIFLIDHRDGILHEMGKVG